MAEAMEAEETSCKEVMETEEAVEAEVEVEVLE